MVNQIVTEGDRAIRSNIARRQFNLSGKGIKIGIISDSYDAYGAAKTDIKKGELPGRGNPNQFRTPVRVLKDSNQGSDEGRAMLQIVHDIAPGAELLFHTAGDTEKSFATSIRALAKAGADIIVDDVFFPTELFLQDGISARAITEVADRGVIYVSAAGNDGTKSYESEFRPNSTFSFRGSSYEAHDFDPGSEVDLFQEIHTLPGRIIRLTMNWEQPAGKVTTDFDLFLLDRPQLPGTINTILAEGTTVPYGANDPSRTLSYFTYSDSAETLYLLIARRTTTPDPNLGLLKWVSIANNADVGTRYEYVNNGRIATSGGTVYGHPNAAGAIAVGAASYRKTPAFGSKAVQLRGFSSRGGSPILFDQQGNPLSAPEVRQKPEIVAPDGVSTTVPGFNSFSGTSAAAPHIAAVAALMLQRAGGANRLSLTQLIAAMQRTAIAVQPASVRGGFIQADRAVLQSFMAEKTGTAANDVFRGKPVAENLSGLGGDDTIRSLGGFDAVFGGQGKDSVRGGTGNDYLLGEGGNDVLVGGQGSDVLLGDAGRDNLKGNYGNDLLGGGVHHNTLNGGGGRDTFLLTQGGLAIVQDFQDKQDKLGLANGLKFNQLQRIQQGQDTLIQAAGETLARLNGIRANQITPADFVAVTEFGNGD